MATPTGSKSPPPLNPIVSTKSFGVVAVGSAGVNGAVGLGSANSVLIFDPGKCAILIAADAVSVGCAPVGVPSSVAVPSSVEQPPEGDTYVLPLYTSAVFTHVARMFASVFTVVCGATPLPAGVVASAMPVASVSRLLAFANAFAIPVCASAVPELETCVASLANPAIAYAAATVDTSFTSTYGVAAAKFPAVGQLPRMAIIPTLAFTPAPGLPPFA